MHLNSDLTEVLSSVKTFQGAPAQVLPVSPLVGPRVPAAGSESLAQ